MNNIRDIQDEILRIKKERNVCILAHSYVAKEIIEIADYTGDSFMLSKAAADTECDTVIMCGVRFMAETVKILSPQKKVYLANPDAGCSMADQMDKELISQLKERYPDHTVVAYINTTADLKTICDVCVTSSSAVKICSQIKNKNILFIPDCNLGDYVAKQLPDKNIRLVKGGCPIHARVEKREAEAAKKAHPDALLLVHPECLPEVASLADYVGSTTGIMNFAKSSESREFIIGTENNIAELLQYECPDKRFYCLSKDMICSNMKMITLPDLYSCIKGNGGEEILLESQTISDAKKCIDKMIELGG
ncbi:MAG: quinolinate synthase NadA [Oscillospiraceae bacterium]|nr:quinolinate synthase NadA [Oscillospiraceae bacterium]